MVKNLALKKVDYLDLRTVKNWAPRKVDRLAQKKAGMKVEGWVRQLVDSGRFLLALAQDLL